MAELSPAPICANPLPADPPEPCGPWLTLVGIDGDGLRGLCSAARQAIESAHTVFGAPRQLALAGIAPRAEGGRGQPWPVPFDPSALLALRGQAGTVALASGDPFWFGLGASLAAHLPPHEWRCFARAGTFSLLAAQLGWRLEDTACLGLHAAQGFGALLPHLAEGRRCMVLVRDGAAALALAQWLAESGWGQSGMWVGESLGAATAHKPPLRHWRAADAVAALQAAPAAAPVAVALQAHGGRPLPAVAGRAEDWFAHDGQITKSPVRAITLAALAPSAGERLWDIGAGSGSIAIEWCLAGGLAACIEQKPARLDNIRQNIARFGLHARMQAVQGRAPQALAGLLDAPPQAVFVGGGLDAEMFAWLHQRLPAPWRLVANAVTLQTQALLANLHARHGGELFKLDMAHAQPLGAGHGWHASRTLWQWAWQC